MKFVAAYLLAHLAGNPSPNKEDVRKILDSVGVKVDEAKMEMLFKEVEGKDVAELIAAGSEKLTYVSSGASTAMDSAPTAANSGAGARAGAGAAVEKKEEKEEKMEEEEDDNMLSLFDD